MDCRHTQFHVHEKAVLSIGSHAPASTGACVNMDALLELFHAAAFWAKHRTTEDMAIAIANSHPVVTVHDGDRLVGFARATSDGVYRATVWDVVVHPDYQGEGLGRKLVETVLMHPHVRNVERVYLMTTHQQAFYERIGFKVNSTTTMVLYNSEGPHGFAPTQMSMSTPSAPQES